MNYAESTLEAIKSKEKTIKEFFLAIRAVLQEHQDLAAVGQHWDQNDIALHNTLLKVQDEVDAALKNNFDTPAALLALMDVISAANKYLRECPQTRKALLLRKIGLYITKILRIFGVVFEKDLYATATEEGQVDTDKILRPVTAALAQFRTSVRSAKSDPNQLLKLCDELRDVTLPPLGIRIEDSGSNPFLFDNPQEIMKDIAERKAQADKIARQKLENKAKSLKSEIEDLEQGKLTPRDVLEKEGYSDFDDQGLPNKQKDGKEVTASAKKNLKKTITGQEKLQKKYQDAIAKDPEVINAKKKELAEIEAKLN
jgi:cysteinyl-tRNA synthetase